MKEYEVTCPKCGCYFMLETNSPELGFIESQCNECSYEGAFEITEEE